MVLTYSTMLNLGTKAPDFSLKDVVSGKTVTLKDFDGKKGLLVMFICKHCPYVQHIKAELGKLSSDFENSDLGIVSISSNDAENYPEDSPENLKKFSEELNLKYPILFDEDQEVARAYDAACTPDFFLFDGEQKLVYRGELDESRRGNEIPVTGSTLRAAISAVLAGKPVSKDQRPSTGCNIKWRAEVVMKK